MAKTFSLSNNLEWREMIFKLDKREKRKEKYFRERIFAERERERRAFVSLLMNKNEIVFLRIAK